MFDVFKFYDLALVGVFFFRKIASSKDRNPLISYAEWLIVLQFIIQSQITLIQARVKVDETLRNEWMEHFETRI